MLLTQRIFWRERILRNPIVFIHLAGLLSHGAAAVTVHLYTSLLRSGLPVTFLENQSLISSAARLYVLFALLVGAMCRHWAVKRMVQPYLCTPDWVEAQKSLLRFPTYQGMISAACWFSAIPIMGLVTLRINGKLNPVSFPHFCLAIVLAGLTVSAYASTFFQFLVARLLAPRLVLNSGEVQNDLIAFKRGTKIAPRLALLICGITTGLFLMFERPSVLSPRAYYELGKFFALSMAISGYCWVLCHFSSLKARKLLESD